MSLRKLIQKKGVTQKHLCEKFSVSRPIMSLIVKHEGLYKKVLRYLKGFK